MIAPGQIFGSWTVVSLDETAKRAICRCVCGQVLAVGVSALLAGQSVSCGCRPLRRERRSARYAEEAELRRRRRDYG
jgi:hypothetical protein